jgi:hypothetical protein
LQIETPGEIAILDPKPRLLTVLLNGFIKTICERKGCVSIPSDGTKSAANGASILQFMSSRRKTILSTALFTVTWLAAVSLGLRTLANYENAPGKAGTVPESWPAASRVPRASDRATLVMFAHPHCPCTRASIAELAQIMAQVQGKVSAHVLFLKPENSGPHWDDTNLRRSAAQIPDVAVATDVDGTEARRFGAETSGHTLLFDVDGRRLFDGGITASRGHAGDNIGQSAIVSLVNKPGADRAQTRVFGCSLVDPTQMANKAPCSKRITN